MSDTTYFRPPPQLRKAAQVNRPRRPQVIEHEPAVPGDRVKPWAFDGTGVHIVPSLLTWENFEVLWHTVDRIRQSSLFNVGDALNAGERQFGDKVWQIDTTGYRPETLRNAQWVARAFPIARRRELPWSYHQVCATSQLTPHEQDELLDMAEEKKRRHEHFTTKDLAALVQEHIAAKQPNTQDVSKSNGGDDLEDFVDQTDTMDRDGQLVTDDDTDEPVVSLDLRAQEALVADLRACMEEVRYLSNEMTDGSFDPINARRLSNRILSLIGRRAAGWASNVLQHSDIALSLVPHEWRVQIGGSFDQGGGRRWEVKVHHRDGHRFVLTDGPSLPCCLTEAGLAAVVSELTQP